MNSSTPSSADLGDVSLRYDVHGEAGPWVTLLHGGMMASSTWETTAEQLADVARVLTFDQRGYGGSSRPADGYTVAQFADDLLRLWDTLRIDRSIVVGFSMGGFVAIEAALTAPERVAALLLVGTAGGVSDAAREAFTRRAEELETATVAQNDARAMAATFRGIADFDRRDELPRILCDVLIACGEQDAALPVEYSRALHEAIPRNRLVVVPGAGHTVHAEQPDEFLRLVRSVVSGSAFTPA